MAHINAKAAEKIFLRQQSLSEEKEESFRGISTFRTYKSYRRRFRFLNSNNGTLLKTSAINPLELSDSNMMNTLLNKFQLFMVLNVET